MELEKVTDVQDKMSHTKQAASLAAEVEHLDVQKPVKDHNDGLSSPISPLKTIQPTLICPPAPRKPKAAPLRKRKGLLHKTTLTLLDYSNDVLALYPPALLADLGNKVKKVKTSSGYHDQQQLKENISTNLNLCTTKLQTN